MAVIADGGSNGRWMVGAMVDGAVIVDRSRNRGGRRNDRWSQQSSMGLAIVDGRWEQSSMGAVIVEGVAIANNRRCESNR